MQKYLPKISPKSILKILSCIFGILFTRILHNTNSNTLRCAVVLLLLRRLVWVVCCVNGTDGGDVAWEGGWSEWGWFSGGSDNGSRYRVFERTSTYHAAQQRCLQLGGYLARIDTIREQVFVEDFLRHMLDTPPIARDGQCHCRVSTCSSQSSHYW